MEGVEIIKQNAKLGDEIFKKLVLGLRKGKFETELDLANFIKDEILKTGGKEAFPTIVTSGKRAGNDIHMEPTNSKMQGFVIIDFGVKKNGFCSDMTRTVYIVDSEGSRGMARPTKEEITLYEIIKKAGESAVNFCNAGFPVAGSDAYVRGVLSQHLYSQKSLSKYFIHTLGHGISKKVHESPKLFYKSKEIFTDGKVITIEPGIYIPKTLAIRIEDMYLINGNKPEQITKSTKKLLIFS